MVYINLYYERPVYINEDYTEIFGRMVVLSEEAIGWSEEQFNLITNLLHKNKRGSLFDHSYWPGISNKYFHHTSDDELVNNRYEDLEFKDILNFYKKFNFFIS